MAERVQKYVLGRTRCAKATDNAQNASRIENSITQSRSLGPVPRPPVDLSHHFSIATSNREGSLVKDFYKYFTIPGIQNLAGGMPHVSYFPYDTLEAAVASPDRIDASQCASGNAARHTAYSTNSAKLLVPKESETSNINQRIDLATALQYSPVDGYPPLLTFIRQFVREHLHPNIPYEDGPEVVLTCGSTDGFSKTIEAFTNVWDENRDWIGDRQGVLCEEFTYMNAIQTAKPRGVNIVPVGMDSEGMKPNGKGGLAEILENWDFSKGRRPHLMYTVTVGQNPTGTVLPVKRRRELYALCQKYDIVIIEDDPYQHLQYPSAEHLESRFRGKQNDTRETIHNHNSPGKCSGYEFLDSLVPSYLSVDTDGRVVRLDTFSKSIAPGCRLGWLTAQPKVVERILRISETTTQFPSGFVQSMVAQLIVGNQGDNGSDIAKGTSGWKFDGWVRWLEGLRGGYERRMQSMCTIFEEGKFTLMAESSARGTIGDWEVVDKVQMFDFDFPRGGMFVWVKACLETHPLWTKVAPADLGQALWKRLMKKPYLCLAAPGQLFAPTDGVSQKSWPYLRVSFAPMDDSEIARSSHSFVDGFRSFWQVKDIGDIDDD